MTPKKRQSLVSFFQEMFKVAYGITEFQCLPSLCVTAAFALKYDFPLKFNPRFVEFIESVHDLEMYFHNEVLLIVLVLSAS